MNDKVYETEEQIVLLENELQGLKKEYTSHKMTKEQTEQLHQIMKEAKHMESMKQKRTGNIKFVAAAALRSSESLSYCRIHQVQSHMQWNRYRYLASL